MRLVILALLLAACASPDRAFWGSDEQRVTLQGRDYAVWLRQPGTGPGGFCLVGEASVTCRRGTARPQVQVIRLGYARRSEHAAILLAMRQAAEQVSGCTLVEGSRRGDSGVMTADLDCPAR